MAEIIRVSPEDVRPKVKAGEALLVCAYDNEGKFSSMRLEGAISLKDLDSRLPAPPHEQEIVFYCA